MRPRFRFLLVLLIAFGCGGSPATTDSNSVPPPSPRTRDEVTPPPAPMTIEGTSVLDEVRQANSPPNAPPTREFRAGHVTAHALDRSAIRNTASGFRIQLPSGAPVVTPTVYDGLVLTSGGFHSREVYAFHATTGAVAWAISLDDDGPSAAACEAGVCVFNTESCTLFAVDARTGRMLWSLWLGDPLTSAPAIANGLVYSSYPAGGGPSGNTHALAAFDLRTGEVRWSRWIDSDVMSAPVAMNGRIYAATFAGTMYEMEPMQGEILAAHRVRATSAPIAVGTELVYTRRTDANGSQRAREGIAQREQGGGPDRVSADRDAQWLAADVQAESAYAQAGQVLDTSNGFGGGVPSSANAMAATQNVGRGSVSTMQAFQGSRVVHRNGSLYSALGDRIVSTDARSGSENWNVRVDGDLTTSGGALVAAPALAGESLYVATLGGQVLEIDPASGAIRHRFEVGAPVRSQPVIVNGWIYVGTEDGKLVAINTGDPTRTGWTTWGANSARTGVPTT